MPREPLGPTPRHYGDVENPSNVSFPFEPSMSPPGPCRVSWQPSPLPGSGERWLQRTPVPATLCGSRRGPKTNKKRKNINNYNLLIFFL